MLERCIGSSAGLKGTFDPCVNAFFRQIPTITLSDLRVLSIDNGQHRAKVAPTGKGYVARADWNLFRDPHEAV